MSCDFWVGFSENEMIFLFDCIDISMTDEFNDFQWTVFIFFDSFCPTDFWFYRLFHFNDFILDLIRQLPRSRFNLAFLTRIFLKNKKKIRSRKNNIKLISQSFIKIKSSNFSLKINIYIARFDQHKRVLKLFF